MSGRPNVLFVVEQLRRRVPGGIGTTIRGLLKGLVDVTLEDARNVEAPGSGATDLSVTLYASRSPRGVDPLEDYGRPMLKSALPGPIMVRAWDRKLIDVPRGFDVVHASSFAMPPARHSRLSVTIHDLTWREVPDAFTKRGRRWHEAALRRSLVDASAIVVSSETVARGIQEAGALKEKVHVVPFGCDHLPEPDGQAAETFLKGLAVDGEFLLSVSTLEPRKNLPRLVEAYRLARARLPEPWPLVIVGPSGWGDGLTPAPDVLLAGKVDESVLAALYRRARLLAYVPLAEGFGFPPVEAMREGTPVVASAVPSAETSHDDEGRRVVRQIDPASVEDIAEALVEVATDDALRARLVSAGTEHSAGLTWSETARNYVRIWGSMGANQ